MAEVVRYRVSLSRPHTHLFEVQATFPPAAEGVVALPVWTPGSYLVREFSRHLQDLEARDESGASVAVERIDKRSWRVASRGQVTLTYRMYANELTVRTSHLDGSHGYFNGANLFLYSEALRGARHEVEVVAPEGWQTVCALPREGGVFVAPDYDTLVDSPFEVGPNAPSTFTAAGVPHELVLWGDGAVDTAKLTGDLQKIVETEAAMFGGLPMSRYVFFLYLSDKGRGGLEHQASTALLYPRAQLLTPKGWEDFLTLAAHEYFHLWNIKRIKPKALVPFDYAQESYTSLLWAFEGGTSYYDNLIVRRAGLMNASRYLTRLGETLTALHSTPGRKVQTLAESSLSAWIKLYRPDENSLNTAISYYVKGEVVCALLDLELRRLSGNAKSLDDVMRVLWERYGNGRGVPEDGVEAAAREVAGRELSAFFDRAIRSTGELDYSAFEHVGLEVRFRPKESTTDKGGGPPRQKNGDGKGWLGITTRGSSSVGSVLEGSPAEAAGLYADDELVALDGYKVDASGLMARIEDKRPGDRVRVTVFRRDKLMELEVALGAKPSDAVYLAKVERPTEAQKEAFRAWLGASWDELG